MVSTHHTTFSATYRSEFAERIVAAPEGDSAADQFTAVLDQLLGKCPKASSTGSLSEIDTAPAELIYREKQIEAEQVNVPEKHSDQLDVKSDGKEEKFEETPVDVTTLQHIVKQSESPAIENKAETVKTSENVEVINTPEKVGTPALSVPENSYVEEVTTVNQPIVEQTAEPVKQVELINLLKAAGEQKQKQTQNVETEKLESKIHKQVQAIVAEQKAAPKQQVIEQKTADLTHQALTPENKALEAVQGAKIKIAATTEEAPEPVTIDEFLVAKAEIEELAPKQVAMTQTKLNSAEVSNLAAKIQVTPIDRSVGALARLGFKGDYLSKPLLEIGRDKDSLASLSLLGERTKSQATKESGKTTQLNSRQEKIINQILKLVDQAAKSKDGSSLTIKISPEELGQVTVKVTQRGDQLFARIVPEKKEVEQTVRSGINEVIAQLVSAGFKAENIHVGVGKEIDESEAFNPFMNNLAGRGQENSGNSEANSNSEARHTFRLENGGNGSNAERTDTFVGEKNVVDNGWVA
jgi:flagellar hook-length control protein FliK